MRSRSCVTESMSLKALVMRHAANQRLLVSFLGSHSLAEEGVDNLAMAVHADLFVYLPRFHE